MKPKQMKAKDWIILRLLVDASRSNQIKSLDTVKAVQYMLNRYGHKYLFECIAAVRVDKGLDKPSNIRQGYQ